MPESITAVEIIRQSHQGYSIKPFIIRGNDGSTYFVKGLAKAGGPALISEVLGAELGVRMGLPIPPWELIHIPDELIAFSVIPNVDDLLGGIADSWGTITDLLPEDWLYRDSDHIDQTEPTVAERLEILEMFKDERFWGAL